MSDFGGRRGNGFAAGALYALASSTTALAHPGHGRGGGDFGPAHYLGEPSHLLFVVPLVVLVAALGAHVIRIRRSRRHGGA
jgi:hypothetical protein